MQTQRVGNDRPWLLLKMIDAKSLSLAAVSRALQLSSHCCSYQ